MYVLISGVCVIIEVNSYYFIPVAWFLSPLPYFT